MEQTYLRCVLDQLDLYSDRFYRHCYEQSRPVGHAAVEFVGAILPYATLVIVGRTAPDKFTLLAQRGLAAQFHARWLDDLRAVHTLWTSNSGARVLFLTEIAAELREGLQQLGLREPALIAPFTWWQTGHTSSDGLIIAAQPTEIRDAAADLQTLRIMARMISGVRTAWSQQRDELVGARWSERSVEGQPAAAAGQAIPERKETVRNVAEEGRADSSAAYAALQREIAERARVEQALLESSTRLRLLGEQLPAVLWTTDRDLCFTTSMGAGLVDLGLQPNQLVGVAVAEFFEQNDPSFPPLAAHERALRGESVSFELQWQARTLQCHIEPFFAAQGSINGTIGIAFDVTEQRRAVAALQESEQRLEAFFSQSLDGFFFMLLDTPIDWQGASDREAVLDYVFEHERIVKVNDAMLAQYDLERAAFIGRTPHDFFAHDLTGARRQWTRLFDTGRVHDITQEWKQDGTPIWIEGDYLCLYDTTGRIAGHFGMQRDVTERLRLEQVQMGQRRFFELLATGAPLLEVLTVLVQTIEIQLEGGLCTVLLVDEEINGGRTLRQCVAPSLAPTFGQTLNAVGVPIGPSSGACGVAAFCGAPVIVPDVAADARFADYMALARTHHLRACWSTPFWDSQGHLLGTFAVYYRETRAPSATELDHVLNAAHLAAVAVERTRTEQALRKREELYRLITENTTDVIDITDASGRYCYASPSAQRILGHVPEQLLGCMVADFVHPDDAGWIEERRRLPTALTPLHATYRHRHADGSWRWLDTISTVVTHANEVQIISVARDVTQRRQAEAERQRLEAQLMQAQKLESIGTLAGGIAHDFNNVLSVILGNAQLALLSSSPESEPYSLLTEIEHAATRAASLIRQLLTFSHYQQHERSAVDLNAVLHQVLQLLRPIIGRQIDITLDLWPSLPPILADPTRIEQVIMNLALNARDAMPAGGRLDITTGIRTLYEVEYQAYPWARPGQYVLLRMRDTGIGMDEDTRLRMFEPFFTTKAPSKGTGLGLAVVYGIVKQYEGFVVVDSAPGQGTTFTIGMPVYFMAAGAAAPVAKPDVRGGTETVLVVEDEPALRQLAAHLLTRLGYTVVCADDGSSAVDLVRASPERFDLVILDLIMPRCGGREELAQMRRLRPDLAAIFVTGYDNYVEHQPHGSVETQPPVLHKPYHLDALGLLVRRVLDARTTS